MPEIGEVARIVYYLKKHAVNRVIKSCQAQDDPIVYGKVGTSGAAVAAALKGKKIVDARQQGKYFWIALSSPPHLLMHFGMTGWMKFSNDDTAYYKPTKPDDPSEWPPKFWKFNIELEGEPDCSISFVDARRLARVRLVDAPADQMRNTTPLKENGPDPVIDKDILTADWLIKKMQSKRVPVKALLLDQANISGVGNWVADEVLFNAKIHPEQYSNTLSEAQVKQLHKSLVYVTTTACETLAESDKFPKDWLMKHRWGKGKSGGKLPSGEKIIFLTVGGRTSAVVPSVQKKTGAVAGDVSADDVKDEDEDEDEEEADASEEKEQKPKAKAKAAPKASTKKAAIGSKRKAAETKASPAAKKVKASSSANGLVKAENGDDGGSRRRSTRNKK